MKGKFIVYALAVSLVSSIASWSKTLSGNSFRSSGTGSSWSSSSGGSSWGSGGGGGGHK